MGKLPPLAQLVHGRRAHPQPLSHVPHRQQLLSLHTRKHRRSKTLGKPCVRLDPLDSTPAPTLNSSNNLRPAATPCDAFPRFWEPDVAGSNPVAPTTQSGCDFGELEEGLTPPCRPRKGTVDFPLRELLPSRLRFVGGAGLDRPCALATWLLCGVGAPHGAPAGPKADI